MKKTRDYSNSAPELREIFDSNDPFMSSGHQVKRRRSGQNRATPAWVKSSQQVQALLLRSFPRLKTDPKQRWRAARWARVIHLYFTLMLPFGQVLEEIGTTRNTLLALLRSIRRVSENLRADGSGRRVPRRVSRKEV